MSDKHDVKLMEQLCGRFRIRFQELEPHLFDLGGVQIASPKYEGVEEGKWEVSVVTIIPGCRTLPNGDPGYPDDADCEVHSTHNTCAEALIIAGALIITQEVDNLQMDIGFEQMAEEHEWYKQYNEGGGRP